MAEGVLTYLRTKGKEGAHIKDIAQAIKVKKNSLNTWFYTEGKKLIKSGELHQVAPATFACDKSTKAE